VKELLNFFYMCVARFSTQRYAIMEFIFVCLSVRVFLFVCRVQRVLQRFAAGGGGL